MFLHQVKLGVFATEAGTRLHTWERSTMEEQNRSLILALADRLDRMETKQC
jgi:hypothetical protein